MMTSQWMKNKMRLVFSILIVLYTSTLLSNEINFQTAKLYTADISAKQAYFMQQEGALLIDVRTKREFNTLRAKNSHNIPVFYEKNKKRVFNNNFLKEIYFYAKKDVNKKIILICRSGSRTKLASNLLAYQGFKNVYNVKYGFTFDWLKQKLPTEK